MNNLLKTPLLIGLAASLLGAQDVPGKVSTGATQSHLRGADRCKASQLIGCAIRNSKNDDLGEIQELVLDSANQRIAYAVIAFDKSLGMGEKCFALPWRLIALNQRGTANPTTATLDLDEETLKAAPGFDNRTWPDMASPAWAKQLDGYYRSHGNKLRPTSVTEPNSSGVVGKSDVAPATGRKAVAHYRLRRLIGMSVLDLQHKTLATVEDLVVETTTGSVDGLLLSFGGNLGTDEKFALVVSDALTLNHEANVFVFPCTTADLAAMALLDGKWPPLNDNEWRTQSRERCAKACAGLAGDNGDVIPVSASGIKPVLFPDTYDVDDLKDVKGTIVTVGSIPVGDLKELRVRLRLRTAEGREVIVHAAPASHKDQQVLQLRPGTVVEVTGSPVKYGSRTVLVAGSLTAAGKSARLRDETGQVTWTQK